ncbi:hypothetical protein MKX08_003115 [Trichoderma sp. CBMAI-0020]|nr:hypothetical protein MKX08_003115 [Trichoderma sp. CBMAI-0020]
MWDVVWTDPDRELVGEHKARKEKEYMFKKDDKSQPRRRSASTASSRWSTDSPFAIFRTRGSKKANASSSNAEMASSGSSGVASPAMASSDRSPMSKTFDQGSRRSSSRMSTSFLERLANFESPLNTIALRSKVSKIDLFALKLPDDGSDSSADIPSSPLAIKRFSIEGSISDDLTESEKMRSLVQIFRRSPSTIEPLGNCPLPSAGNAVAPTHLAPGEKSPSLPLSPTTRSKLGPAAMQVSQIDSQLASSNASTKTRITPNSPEAWKPVDEWEPLPLLRGSPEPSSPGLLVDTDSLDHSSGIHNDFRLLHTAVVRMASKSAAEILVTLKTLWKNAAKKDVAYLLGDSAVVEDLRRWMLSTMIHMDKVPALETRVSPRKECLLTARMVVCLYDSTATVAYLAALEPTKQYDHISLMATPKEDLFDNVRIVSVPRVTPTEFPIAPRIYESVHSLTLFSLCPLSLLPGMLNNVYKCLNKKGFIRLILIDPLPRAATLGTRMRMWIEENLLRNLAKQGKCMSPSTAFPPLLAQAHLRGVGSTLTTTKFYAVPGSAISRDQDATKDSVQTEKEAKAQIRSLIGRMLWVEVWGSYVTCNKWWWDDPECVAECLELGTLWEYHAVKGVKELKTA